MSLVAPIEASSAVLDEFRKGFKHHAVSAALRQEKVNAYSARLENSSRLMDGIGQLKYRIDADLYHHMKAIFGPDCWKDSAFTDALERDGVIQRVKGISDKIMSFAPAGKAESQGLKAKTEESKTIISEHTFSENELPSPCTDGVVDGTDLAAA
jgi:hypothetical protein